MKHEQRSICTRSPWNSGTTSGADITMPDGSPAEEIHPFRIRERAEFESRGLRFSGPYNFKIQRGQLYGVRVPRNPNENYAEYLARRKRYADLMITYGYCCLFTRNYGKFVMSRAARKRGCKTADVWYLRRAAEGRLRRMTKRRAAAAK